MRILDFGEQRRRNSESHPEKANLLNTTGHPVEHEVRLRSTAPIEKEENGFADFVLTGVVISSETVYFQ